MTRPMTLSYLMDKIDLKKETISKVNSFQFPKLQLDTYKDLFYTDEDMLINNLNKDPDMALKALVIYLNLGVDAYDSYLNLGYKEKVYLASMLDISIWSKDYYNKTHNHGLTELKWIGKSIRAEVIRLGRLQYEPMSENDSKKIYGLSGAKALSVHIPAGLPLDSQACLKSMTIAKDVFKDSDYLVCDSWLLDPKLKDILPENSNIIKFQNLFEIVEVHYTYPQAEERIFKKILKNKEFYPETSYLQAQAKALYLRGGNLGIGRGVRKILT